MYNMYKYLILTELTLKKTNKINLKVVDGVKDLTSSLNVVKPLPFVITLTILLV